MNGRGYSLIEALMATAVMAIVALVAGAIVHETSREARAAEAAQVAFEDRWLAVQRLRAEVERASSASVTGATLRLRGSGWQSSWRACGGALVREGGPAPARGPTAPPPCDGARFSLRAVGQRTVVAWDITHVASGQALLGGPR